ncbi:MAG: AAA family ATPase [Streptosporangiaceae bacterium]|jgi:uncharacterized protein
MANGGSESAPEPYAAVAETASAVVFLAGDRACKLKKPVSLGFLDFTTRQARAAACERETELNRRFAPDVYLGVASVHGAAGELCDHLVMMRRMPAGRRLSALVRAGEPADGALRQVARIVAAQHERAHRSAQIAAEGSRDAVLRRWDDSLAQLASLPARQEDRAMVTEIGLLARRFLAGREPLFDRRVAGGRIIDGHGDLLADDIYCLADGPRVLDCLDFDDRLRWLDGLDDAAFLAMDLERLGVPDLARHFTDWYAEYSGDPAPASLRHHYVAYRALVRAKIARIRAAQDEPAAGCEAQQLAGIALRHLHAGAVTLVLVGGLPGTGKSTLAGPLADRLGWTILTSDRIRKELAGTEPGDDTPVDDAAAPYGTGIYTAEWTQRCYAELLHRAAALLATGESVIADASWLSARQRAAAAAVAGAASADLIELRCEASAALTARRLTDRRLASRRGDLSDADPEVAARLAAAADPWPSATVIDTEAGSTEPAGTGPSSVSTGEPVRRALEVIRPHGPQHVWRPSRPVLLPD